MTIVVPLLIGFNIIICIYCVSLIWGYDLLGWLVEGPGADNWINDPPHWLYREEPTLPYTWRERIFHVIWNFQQWFWRHGGHRMCRLFMHQYRNHCEHLVETDGTETFITYARCLRCGDEEGKFACHGHKRCLNSEGKPSHD